jgi:hypothetical protein
VGDKQLSPISWYYLDIWGGNEKNYNKEIDLKQLILYKSNTLPHTYKPTEMPDNFRQSSSD